MSLRPGNSLKGFQFYDDEGKVQASYYFKDGTLDIWSEITDERLEEIKRFAETHSCDIIRIIRHY